MVLRAALQAKQNGAARRQETCKSFLPLVRLTIIIALLERVPRDLSSSNQRLRILPSFGNLNALYDPSSRPGC
jgi:hypothetical protein